MRKKLNNHFAFVSFLGAKKSWAPQKDFVWVFPKMRLFAKTRIATDYFLHFGIWDSWWVEDWDGGALTFVQTTLAPKLEVKTMFVSYCGTVEKGRFFENRRELVTYQKWLFMLYHQSLALPVRAKLSKLIVYLITRKINWLKATILLLG